MISATLSIPLDGAASFFIDLAAPFHATATPHGEISLGWIGLCKHILIIVIYHDIIYISTVIYILQISFQSLSRAVFMFPI